MNDYLKYGEPKEGLIYIKSACETALLTYLNDPDYEVVKDTYYLRQTSKSYIYKMTIRGKNAFGGKILKELTFSLQYNPFDKMYQVTNIK